MDQLSITTAYVGFVGTITKVSILISRFVRKTREPHEDLDSVSKRVGLLGDGVFWILSEGFRVGRGS